MKQKLIVALVAGAIGSMAAVTAHAGVIQATYKVYAAETIGSDAIKLVAPVVSYNLAQPLSGTLANPNNFKVALTIDSGEWDAAALPNAQLRTPDNLITTDAAAGVLSADKKTVTYAFTLNDGNTYSTNSTITFGNVTVGKISKLASALGMPADDCAPAQRQVNATVKFTNASDIEFESNFTSAPLKNTEAILASNVALKVSAIASSAYTATGDAGAKETATVDVLNPSLSTAFSATALNGSTDLLNIGAVEIADRGSFFDNKGDVAYSVTDADFAVDATGDGGVSAATLNLVVTGKFAAATAGAEPALFLAADAACATPLTGATANATFNAARDTATFAHTITAADWALTKAAATALALPAADTMKAYICYSKPASTTTIPTAQFAVASGSVVKTAGSAEATNKVCPASIYNLGANGVRVDVRNYVPASVTANTGWLSSLRLINTDESQTVDVTAQYLDENGKLVGSGKIATLAPLAAKYVSNTEVQTAIGTLPASGNNTRLRVSANGSSLRVQNYLYNPATGNFIEASSSQGDEQNTTGAAGPLDKGYTKTTNENNR